MGVTSGCSSASPSVKRGARSSAGCLLVALVVLAEYGAFEILGFQTFTTEIFSEFTIGFDTNSACALSIVLVLLSFVILFGEHTSRGSGRISRSGAGAQRAVARLRLGKATIPVLLGYLALVGAALGVPIGASIYWILESRVNAFSGVSLPAAAGSTALYGVSAAFIATLAALPVAVLTVRRRGVCITYWSAPPSSCSPCLAWSSRSRSPTSPNNSPVAFCTRPPRCSSVRTHCSSSRSRSSVCARRLLQAPHGLEEVASSLGVSRFGVFFRVTLPLIAPGLGAAFCLVFLSCVTELTATLILIPTGAQTLASQFWSYEQNLSYGQAAPFALVIIAIAAVPSYVLGRFFDRLPRAGGQGPIGVLT